MRAALLILAACALASCGVHVAQLTPAQSIYVALGAYESAQAAAANYAETPTADPKVVHKIAAVNDATATQTAVAFGRAYRSCHGSTVAVVPGLQCSMFDFSAVRVNVYAASLRSIAAALLAR
jgi:hypothetical protein